MSTPYEDEAISFPVGVASAPPFNWWLSVANRRIGQATITRGRQYELDTVQTGEYHPTYDNRDGALSPSNPSSPYSPFVTPYRAVRKRLQSPATQNMLTANQASSGEALVGSNGVDGPIAPGNTVPQAFSAVANPVVTASGTAFEGTQVLQVPVQANFAAASALVWAPGWSVVPGSPHTFSSYVRTTTGTAALTAQAVISWVNAAGTTVISSATGSSVSLPVASTTWTRLTVTGTPPAGAAGGFVSVQSVNSPTAAYILQVDGMQLEYAAAATAWTKPGTWYAVFNGWVERWPLRWDYDGLFTKTDVTAVDHFGYLSQQLLKPPFYMDMLTTGPRFCYTFDVGQAATYVTDLSHNRGPAPVTASPRGAGVVTFGSSINQTTKPSYPSNPAGGGFLGGSGQVATFANPQFSTTSGLVGLSYVDLGAAGVTGPPGSGGWTRLVAFRCPGPTSSTNNGVWTIWQCNPPAWVYTLTFAYFGIYVSAVSGVLQVAINGNFYTINSPRSYADGDWHMLAFQLSADGKTVTFTLDAVAYGTTFAADQHYTGPPPSDTIGASVQHGVETYSDGLIGDIAFAAEFGSVLSAATLSNLYNSWRSAWIQDSSATRYSRILAWAGFQGASNITTGALTGFMGPASDITAGGQAAAVYSPTSGTDVQTALQNVATTENGNHYIAADGSIVFQSRAARYGVFPPIVTFGENAASGEIPYDDCRFDFDMTRLANNAQVTQYVNSTVYESFNATSQAQYGTRTLTRTINSLNVAECNDASNYLTYKYGNPDLRIQSLRVHVTANPSAWAQLLALEFSTRCRVMRRDLSGTIQWDGFLEQVNWTFDYANNDVYVDIQLSPADLSAFWQENAMHTTLNTSVSAGATSLVLAPLNTSANLPIGAYMSYSYPVAAGTAPGGGSTNPALTLRLEPGTANQEDVTVTGLTSTGGSGGLNYTSFTATLAAGTTFAHTSGVTVSERLTNPYSGITTTNSASQFDSNAVLGTTTILSY